MNGKTLSMVAAGLLGAACLVDAHIVKGSLSLKGGETLTAGSTVNITWTQQFGHSDGKYQIRYSSNGGTTWTDVENPWQGPKGDNAAMTFPWTVPSTATTQGKIHVSFIRGGLTDADYNLISGNFTVSGTSAIREAAPGGEANLRFNPSTRNLDVTFSLEKASKVSVLAFDAQGKAVATLLEGEYASGSHRLSVFSNGLAAGRSLFFQLRLGDQVQSFQ